MPRSKEPHRRRPQRGRAATRALGVAPALATALAPTLALAALLALGATWPAAEANAASRPQHKAGHGAVAGKPFARSQRAAIGAFAADLAAREGLATGWVLAALGRAQHVAAVQRLIMPPPPGQPKNWQAYRERFIEPQRIGAGLAFWRANESALQRAEERYGVPPAIVVAIVGVETFYGRVVGNYRVLDALATLAFDFPPGRKDRSAFFRDELEAFLLWCHREGIEPAEPRGSYAGAIGLPQFMPSSLARYGIDFDGDGHVDLRRSAADAVGSVAHYLAEFGWQRGLPTHYAVRPPDDEASRTALLAPDIVPSFSAAQLAERGVHLAPAALAHVGPLALVALENGGGPWSYVAGSTNFYALTRYNWSSYYALAVISLAEALKAAR